MRWDVLVRCVDNGKNVDSHGSNFLYITIILKTQKVQKLISLLVAYNDANIPQYWQITVNPIMAKISYNDTLLRFINLRFMSWICK